jgi:antitoxin component YwqK of YwqJK toxin-antitoxin module
VETSYGLVKVNKADIKSIDYGQDPAPAKAAKIADAPATPGEEFETPSAAPEAPEPIPLALAGGDIETDCKTESLPYGGSKKTYYVAGEEVSREILDSGGRVIGRSGKIPDGVVKESYKRGGVKIEKNYKGGLANGQASAYYASGKLQAEIFYFQDKPEGVMKIYSENGNLLSEQTYKAGILDGIFREYDAEGNLRNQSMYRDGVLVSSLPVFAAPKPVVAAAVPAGVSAGITVAPAASQPAPISTPQDILAPPAPDVQVKTKELARGTEYRFYREKNLVGKQVLNKDYQVTKRTGKSPGGVVRMFYDNGALEAEMNFTDVGMDGFSRFYYESGSVRVEALYSNDKLLRLKEYDSSGKLSREADFEKK